VREPTYFVLVSLADGPLHGHGIIADVQQLSEGRVRLTTGALYTVLDRLTGEGQVRTVGAERVAGRIRRYYGLTPSGLASLRAEFLRKAAAGVAASAGGAVPVRRIVSLGGRVRLGAETRAI
jgi:PadR family transcriptional regulator, regulatory protein PadR